MEELLKRMSNTKGIQVCHSTQVEKRFQALKKKSLLVIQMLNFIYPFLPNPAAAPARGKCQDQDKLYGKKWRGETFWHTEVV